MKHNEPISHIMTTGPVTVHHGDPISKVRRIFQKADIHHLPVVNGDKLIGMVSWTDLMRVSFGDAFDQTDQEVDATLDHTHAIEDIMTPNPVTLDHNSTIREAVSILSEASFHSLPVVDGEKLVGIVTTQDLLRFLHSLY